MCGCVRVCVCVRACVRGCVRPCVYVSMARVCVCVRALLCQFSEQLADPEAVFTNQKRLSHYKQQESQSNHSNMVQRPRLKTTVNAKIPTALRQKFLDGFVDEHLKMAGTAQGAYQQVCVLTDCPCMPCREVCNRA